MKTPKSASKPEKGGSALNTPTSGKISKNKSTPMSLKAKVLEKNAKLALLKSQDTMNLNGKSPKTPKNVGTPKKGGSPKNAPKGSPKNTPKGSPQNSPKGPQPVSPKNAKKGGANKPAESQNQSPKPNASPALNGTAGKGKKRKSLEGTPATAADKKSKKTAGVSPEVQLGLKIEKLLESPKDSKKPAESAQPGSQQKSKNQKKREAKLAKKKAQQGSPAPVESAQAGSNQPKSKNQKKKAAKLAKKNAQQGSPAPVDQKKKKLQEKVVAKKLDKKEAQKQKPQPTQKSEEGKNGQKKGKNAIRKEQKAKLLKTIEDRKKEVGDADTGPFPKPEVAKLAIRSLLEDEKEVAAKKPGLLDEPAPILLVVDFVYHPPAPKAVQRIALPNPHLNSNADVIFIAPDMKKAKKDPEESVEYHTELFRKSGITSISEILPLRKIFMEYSQYEEKRKLANRADAFLIDGKIAHRISAIFPRKLTQKKAPIPIRMHLEPNKLQKEVATALKKTAVVLLENSLSVAIRVGHIGMKVEDLADNLNAVVAALCDEAFYPGGKSNIRQLNLKTPKSEAYPLYIAAIPRSQVPEPKALAKKKKKKHEVVEGEVTTAGVTVAVHPSGKVEIKSKDPDLDETEHDTSPKKKKTKKTLQKDEDSDSDAEEDDDSDLDDGDSGDDLDPAEIENFLKANKVDDEDEDDGDSENEIEKAEQRFLNELIQHQKAVEARGQKAKKAGKIAPEDADDDDESESDEDGDDLDDEEEEDIDDEEDLDDEEDESDDDVPQLVPAKAAQPKKSKGGKPGQNGLQAKGKPAQKGKPNAAQKRGAPQKTKNSPKAKRR